MAAIIKAVWPASLRAFTSQRAAIRRCAITISPLNATPIRLLLPLVSVAQGFAPFWIRKSTVFACPLYAASISAACSGFADPSCGPRLVGSVRHFGGGLGGNLVCVKLGGFRQLGAVIAVG